MPPKPMFIGNLGHGRYRIRLDTDDGSVVCDISVALKGQQLDTRTAEQKKQAALAKAKALAKALDAAVPNTRDA